MPRSALSVVVQVVSVDVVPVVAGLMLMNSKPHEVRLLFADGFGNDLKLDLEVFCEKGCAMCEVVE